MLLFAHLTRKKCLLSCYFYVQTFVRKVNEIDQFDTYLKFDYILGGRDRERDGRELCVFFRTESGGIYE